MIKLALIATILVLATVFVYIVNDIKSLSYSDKLEANWPSDNFLWCRLASSHLNDYVEGTQGCKMEVPFCKNLFYPCILELDCTGVYNICGKNVSCYCTPTPATPLVQSPEEIPMETSNPTITFTPTPISITTDQYGIRWMRRQFGVNISWDIEYPEDWKVDYDPTHGSAQIEGPYIKRNFYQINMGYPIGLGVRRDGTVIENFTLEKWVDEDLSIIPVDKKAKIKRENATIAGTNAVKILNLPKEIYDDGVTVKYSDDLTHCAYISERGNKSMSRICINSVLFEPNDVFDPNSMEEFFSNFLSRIR